MKEISFLLFFLFHTSQAFVARLSPVVGPITARLPTTSLEAFDPSHLIDATSMILADEASSASNYIPGTSGEVSYSQASYYTILGLYLLSFPGLWSVIKRSTTAKIKRKTFVGYVGGIGS